jgi:hypothetical protein
MEKKQVAISEDGSSSGSTIPKKFVKKIDDGVLYMACDTLGRFRHAAMDAKMHMHEMMILVFVYRNSQNGYRTNMQRLKYILRMRRDSEHFLERKGYLKQRRDNVKREKRWQITRAGRKVVESMFNLKEEDR